MSPRCPCMKDLPENVVFNMLLRLPVKTIINCKCVCNKWRNLLSDSHFVHHQIQRSPDQCLLIYHFKFIELGPPPGTLKLLEIENELHHNHLFRDPFMSLDTAHLFPKSIISTVGSVNGLICLWELGDECDNTYICNPITKEYMILPKQQFDVDNYWDVKCGFGVSATGEYKVIRFWRRDPFKIEVYTLGTDKWRTLGQVPEHSPDCGGLFFNNQVHWITYQQLFSLDLDNETFQLSPLPPPPFQRESLAILGVLKGCLSLYSKSDIGVITIWLMKEHLWNKEFKFNESIIPFPKWLPVSLIDGLNGRSILFFMDKYGEEDDPSRLLAYCLETNTIEDTRISDNLFTVISYRPSFLKLENFHPAKVHVF